MAMIIKTIRRSAVGAFGTGMILPALAGVLFSPMSSVPALAQDSSYILFYASAREARHVKYCGISPADVRYPGKKLDQKGTRRLLCKSLVTRLRMGIEYPDAPGSCPGYDKSSARQCMQDGINLNLLVRRR